MKTFISTLVLLGILLNCQAQTLYSKAFGKPTDPAIIFLHGGPGYNCANFEGSAAQFLSEKGFYVIVYDRRGEGRSGSEGAEFSFKQTFEDIDGLYQQYGIQKASLIGHSFGGIVATLYAEKNRKKINSIFLVGAPVSLQTSFKTIMRSSKAIYEAKNDSTNLNYIKMLEEMNPLTLQYSSYCFMHAMQNGFYQPKNPSDASKAIYAELGNDSILAKLSAKMTYEAVTGFWKNEKYTGIELGEILQKLVKKKVRIYGLYGKEDGLYSAAQVEELQGILGESNLRYLDDCSHSVFIDQREEFANALQNWME